MVAIFFAITLSIDALGVGMSFGLRGRRPGIVTYVTVFGVSLFVMAAAVFFGSMITSFLTPEMAELAAGVWIFLLGLWIVLGTLKTKLPEEPKQNKRCGKILQAFSLALMLSIDSMGAGLAAAALGIGIAFLPVYVAAFQTTFLFLGVAAATKLPFAKKGGSLPTVVSGVLLMAIGIIGLV